MPNSELEPSKRHFINRRQFLGMSTTVVAAAGYKAIEPALNQLEQWSASDVDNDTFISQNADKLRHVNIGMTFRPEEYGLRRGYRKDSSPYKIAQYSLTNALSNLRMRDIRLGLRWDAIEPKPGTIDLSFYDPFIRKMLSWNASVCMTVGAKSPGFPEYFYPTYIQEDPEVDLKPGITIDDQSVLGNRALDYTQRLTDKLASEYGDNAFETIQLENEPLQRVAEYKHKFDSSYLFNMADIVSQGFPNSNILLNTSEIGDLDYIRIFMVRLKDQIPSLDGKLIIGDNFYYQKSTKGLISKLPFIKHLDPVAKSQILSFQDIISSHHQECRQEGIRNEVTEAQAEKWGSYTFPAESPRGLRYVIKRNIDEILDISMAKQTHENAVIRLWGYEQESLLRYTGGFKDGNRERFDLIAKINRI